MVPRLEWRNLIPGIIAIVVLVGATLVVLMNGGIGRVPGEKISLHVVTTSARGVMKGTPVWVSGQQVGTVDEISFRPAITDSSRVVLSLRVQEKATAQIRRDSDIRVQSGANIIGPMVVYITAGTPGVATVRDGDTLRANTQSDLAASVTQLGEATKQVDPIMADVRVILAQARDPRGTLGAVRTLGAPRGMADLRAQVSALRAQLVPEGGSPSRAALMRSVRRTMAEVDSIRALLASENASLGRFRRDSTLGRTVASVRDRLDTLRSRLDSADGSLGRFQRDSSVTWALADARREMALLFEDIRKRPLRYIAF
ncbi:MAG TPA: MlaD family protein [Gemmatimonadaceae bacterium]|nr:MlaD family protein [Gemmatimonadaceae bacterium]